MVWQRLRAQHAHSSALVARTSRFVLVVFVVALFVGGALLATTHAAFAQDIDAVQEEVDAIRSTPPIWTDSFREDEGVWELDDSDDSYFLRVESSNYRVGVVDEQIYAWGRAEYEAENLLVEVDAYSIDGEPNNEFGIILRHEDIENFYTFLASTDGTYTVRRLENNSWVDIVPWATSDLIDQTEGAVNRVGAYANGTTLALLINGTVVEVFEDESFSGGAIGLAAGSFNVGDIEIAFDDLSVWNLDELAEPAEPEATPVALPTPAATEEPTDEPTIEATPEVVTPEPLETPELVETPTPEPVDILGVLDLVRNGELAVRDNFSRDVGNWDLLTDSSSTAEIASREMSVHIADPNWLAWATLNDHTPAEFLVEVDAAHADGAEENMFGIVFHVLDDANFDFFALSSDGRWSFWRLTENEWESVQTWTPSDAVEPGLNATNRMGVLAQNGSVTLMVNETVLGVFDDDTTIGGAIGLSAGTLEEGDVTAVFDNFDLWLLDQSAINGATPVATAEATEEPVAIATEEPAEQPTEEPTAEPSEIAVSIGGDATAQIEALLATEPVYTSAFTRDDGAWSTETDEGVDHYYEGRQLHLLVDTENWLTWSLSNEAEGSDFLAQVDATQTAGPEVNEYGLAFRFVDDDNFYAFFVSGNGYWNLSKLLDGEWITLNDWTASGEIQPLGGVNRLGVLADGETITLLVNGVQLGQITDDSFSAGGFALLTGTFDDPGVDVAFDNFALYAASE